MTYIFSFCKINSSSEAKGAYWRRGWKCHVKLWLGGMSIKYAILRGCGQCYFSCDFLVIVIVKVIIFSGFQLQF